MNLQRPDYKSGILPIELSKHFLSGSAQRSTVQSRECHSLYIISVLYRSRYELGSANHCQHAKASKETRLYSPAPKTVSVCQIPVLFNEKSRRSATFNPFGLGEPHYPVASSTGLEPVTSHFKNVRRLLTTRSRRKPIASAIGYSLSALVADAGIEPT